MKLKICTTCKQEKPLSEYYKISNGADGVRPRCKDCHREFEREKYAGNANWRQDKLDKQRAKLETDPDFKKAHRFRVRRWHLKHNYGLTMADYREMNEAQNGVCAICGNPSVKGNLKRDLVVDHCHTTGKVRGLLCDLCNTAIGKLQDDPELIRKAAAYLERNLDR